MKAQYFRNHFYTREQYCFLEEKTSPVDPLKVSLLTKKPVVWFQARPFLSCFLYI